MTHQTTTEMSVLEADIFAMIWIKKEWLGHELSLFSTKWFDYRQLTPAAATELYVEAYRKAYAKHYRGNIDIRSAEYVKPLGGENPLQLFANPKYRNKMAGCWRGRMMADAIGIPYDVYTDLAMGFRLRYWSRTTLPLPQHLYHELDLEKVLTRWDELQASRLYYSQTDTYKSQSYQGIDYQNDHHEWLWKQANLRVQPEIYLGRFIAEGLLPMSKILARLPAERHAALHDAVEQAAISSL